MNRLLPVLLLVSPAALLASCGADPRTEIVVVVDSDLTVPGELDGVVIEVTAPSGTTQSTMGDLSAHPLPRSVGVLWVEGPLQPVTVRARGMLAGTQVVERVARTSFLKGKTLVLFLALRADCVDVACADEQTCEDGACRSIIVAANGLPAWTGEPPRLDAGTRPMPDGGMDASIDSGVSDAGALDTGAADTGAADSGAVDTGAADTGAADTGAADTGAADTGAADTGPGDAGPPADACVPTGPEICNGIDDNCNLMVDEGFDLTRDVDNCGACGHACNFAHGAGHCAAGVCVIDRCDTDYDDCNGDVDDGCEAFLRFDRNNCGRCGNMCGSGRRCCSSMCQMGMC